MDEPEILLVDDDDDLRPALVQGLELDGFRVRPLARADKALEHVTRSFHGVIVSDIRMPGMDGMGLMRRVMEIDPALPVILITGHGDVALAVAAMFTKKPNRSVGPLSMST